eukprot:4927058-Amphidinium_carterae.1
MGREHLTLEHAAAVRQLLAENLDAFKLLRARQAYSSGLTKHRTASMAGPARQSPKATWPNPVALGFVRGIRRFPCMPCRISSRTTGR